MNQRRTRVKHHGKEGSDFLTYSWFSQVVLFILFYFLREREKQR